MQINRETLLCRYHYDPLDRLVDCTPTVQATTRRFYQKDRLATETQGAVQRSIMQHDDQLLAEQQRQSDTVDTRLLATDQQRSVLTMVDASSPRFFAYTPYGHRPLGNGLLSLLGFNGERPDPVTGYYLLGNGYRAFNPVLMRFNSPDSWSPFGEGGLNAYAYNQCDPINFTDQTGHMRGIKSLFGRSTVKSSTVALPSTTSGKMKNIKKLADNAFTFESTHKGGSRITIAAHGSETNPRHLKVGDQLWNADTVIDKIQPKNYDQVRILACLSDELGAEIAIKTGKEVKAYIGNITTNLTDAQMKKIYEFYGTNISELNIKLNIRKENKYNPKTQPLEHAQFNYQPVRFKP